MIPKNIFQIYHDKGLVPKYIKDRLVSLNHGYNYSLLDFEDGKKSIIKDFKDLDSGLICKTIDSLPRYCHKSDLLRYCLLYLYGGFYLDVDLEILAPFDHLSTKGELLTSFGRGAESFTCVFENGQRKHVHKIMANGIFAAKKNSPILLDLIKFCIDNPADKNPTNRGIYIKFLYNYLNKQNFLKGGSIKPFSKVKIKNENVYLFDTIDSENYGSNCIYDLNIGVIINPNNILYKIPRQTSSFI